MKPEPPEIAAPLFAEFGRRRMLAHLSHIHALDDGALLGFVYLSPGRDETYITVCIESLDKGKTWSLRSIPGPYQTSFEERNRFKKHVEGLCEPSVTCLRNRDLMIVMRLGSWQPLHTSRSSDGGRTWLPTRAISVDGILPTILALPEGVLALASGRPDNTLSFSLDDGESWTLTIRLREHTNPRQPSTRNNTMFEVEPGRLL